MEKALIVNEGGRVEEQLKLENVKWIHIYETSGLHLGDRLEFSGGTLFRQEGMETSAQGEGST